MKKVIPGIVCLLLMTACEIPQSITIKGNPGLYVPLGNPIANKEFKGKSLEDLISPDNIKKMMNDKKTEAGLYDDLNIYEVDRDLAEDLGITPEAQTYLVRYPLAKMPLDLKQYADEAMAAVNEEKLFTIPNVPVLPANPTYLTEENGQETTYNPANPFLKIPLKDMVKLVMWVEADGIFGLEIDYRLELEQYLELKIPGFDIDWKKGEPTDDNGNPTSTNPTKLRYYNPTKKTFYPRAEINSSGSTVNSSDLTDGNLLVYARIFAPLPKQTHTPSLIFEWEKAMIDTTTGTDGSFIGEYPINNNLSEFLGKGVSFKKVDGYMYMSGVQGNGSMSIGIYDSNNTSLYKKEYPLNDVDAPRFPPDGAVFTKSYGDILLKDDKMSLDDTLDLKNVLNANGEKLEVAIFIEQMEIKKDDVQNEERTDIQFDLVILIPLDLEVSNEADEVTTDKGIKIKDNYVMLDLGDSLKNLGEGDLFGRKKGEDNYLKDIEYVNIGLRFSKSDINIIDPSKLAVLVTTDGSRLLEFKNNTPLRLDGAFLNTIPFSPKFSILLAKDDKDDKNPTAGKKDFGSFKILRPDKPKFDFTLYVEAKAALEYKLDL